MNYNVSLVDPKTQEVIEFVKPHHWGYGAMVGMDRNGNDIPNRYADMNITYNYGRHFHLINKDEGLRFLDGMPGGQAATFLLPAITSLSQDRDPDYWKPTEGNVRVALEALLWFALKRPDGIFEVL